MTRPGHAATALLVVALGVGASACGTTDPAARERLPPIVTTIATTTTTTTTIPPGQRFYTVKQGDTLGKIAASFEVTVQSIVDLNKLVSPDAIQAGQTLEIPSGVVVVAELPSPAASTSAP
jgi:LysM repeat protein